MTMRARDDMSEDLVAWLLEQIAKDEGTARDAAGEFPEWVDGVEETSDGENVYFTVEPAKPRVKAWKWELDYFLEIDDRTGARVAHIARWDPARVLAECAAKRRIVELHTEAEPGPHECPGRYSTSSIAEGDPCETLRLLAQPYADRRGFREEWRA
jgi:hypothetical protein